MSREASDRAHAFSMRVHLASEHPDEFDFDVVNQICAPCSEEMKRRFAKIVASHRLWEVLKLQDRVAELEARLAPQ